MSESKEIFYLFSKKNKKSEDNESEVYVKGFLIGKISADRKIVEVYTEYKNVNSKLSSECANSEYDYDELYLLSTNALGEVSLESMKDISVIDEVMEIKSNIKEERKHHISKH